MKRFSFLTSADAVTLIFIGLLIFLQLMFAGRIEQAPLYLSVNICLCIAILSAARYIQRHGETSMMLVRLFRDWYLVPCILIIYTQTSSMAYSLHQRDYDSFLIKIDQMLFGVNPTQWISQFAHPVFTEILQIAYSSYYLFFIALFYELYRRSDHTDFRSGAMLVVYGFYLSYVGYLLFPAIGPRFTLHDFFSTDIELPGLVLTPYLRHIVNAGGGIPLGAADPMLSVHRDAFPSGHTQLTLVAMYVAFLYHTKIRWWLFVGGSLLIISTIYMRYHYVIDVVVGMLFFVVTIWTGRKINRWWNEGIKNV